MAISPSVMKSFSTILINSPQTGRKFTEFDGCLQFLTPTFENISVISQKRKRPRKGVYYFRSLARALFLPMPEFLI
ncbi:hypothetical protein I2750_09510 [Bacillus sp. PR5]|nr:hypothetical protein [Bacillus sp. PR5]